MNKVIKWLKGFIAGIKALLSYTRVIQEEWQSRVMKGKESYESFWSWQKGYKIGNNLRNKFLKEH